MTSTALQDLLIRMATDPVFADAVRDRPEALTEQFGLSPAEAATIATTRIGTTRTKPKRLEERLSRSGGVFGSALAHAVDVLHAPAGHHTADTGSDHHDSDRGGSDHGPARPDDHTKADHAKADHAESRTHSAPVPKDSSDATHQPEHPGAATASEHRTAPAPHAATAPAPAAEQPHSTDAVEGPAKHLTTTGVDHPAVNQARAHPTGDAVAQQNTPAGPVHPTNGGVLATGLGPILAQHNATAEPLNATNGGVLTTGLGPLLAQHNATAEPLNATNGGVLATGLGPLLAQHNATAEPLNATNGGVLATGLGPILAQHDSSMPTQPPNVFTAGIGGLLAHQNTPADPAHPTTSGVPDAAAPAFGGDSALPHPSELPPPAVATGPAGISTDLHPGLAPLLDGPRAVSITGADGQPHPVTLTPQQGGGYVQTSTNADGSVDTFTVSVYGVVSHTATPAPAPADLTPGHPSGEPPAAPHGPATPAPQPAATPAPTWTVTGGDGVSNAHYMIMGDGRGSEVTVPLGSQYDLTVTHPDGTATVRFEHSDGDPQSVILRPDGRILADLHPSGPSAPGYVLYNTDGMVIDSGEPGSQLTGHTLNADGSATLTLTRPDGQIETRFVDASGHPSIVAVAPPGGPAPVDGIVANPDGSHDVTVTRGTPETYRVQAGPNGTEVFRIGPNGTLDPVQLGNSNLAGYLQSVVPAQPHAPVADAAPAGPVS
ncbi:hypothetical protein [Pseudonocardia sp. GCM10023141]|uniref:hypothetical protein n=1 Tax=Pseudonocardia sp. GCM10023141 TaxID=3252653 RepID=UPI00360C2FA9